MSLTPEQRRDRGLRAAAAVKKRPGRPLPFAPAPPGLPQITKRFWASVSVRGDGECWKWIGAQTHGYGSANIDGRRKGAHRVLMAALVGPIPRDLFVCHRCDNPLCCNPSHLFLGNHADNMRDMVMKGRARGRMSSPRAEASS